MQGEDAGEEGRGRQEGEQQQPASSFPITSGTMSPGVGRHVAITRTVTSR